ncbi:hypothetical protein H4R18_000983 [Coemansia javaensis]|uniref:Sugar phosphate transporter domain-containing protein n=1 Tax=Coemansia javaensis TaxID=2761396 RepID=A0A9W8HMX5_9FUNG|nr:hypothetical protein H4R18_000983 [Coemansia javaensis]
MQQDAGTELTERGRWPAAAAAAAAATAATKPAVGLAALLRNAERRRHLALCALYLAAWYALSGLLSVYNKWLFGASERNFPFPLLVTSVHMLAQYVVAALCLRTWPALRPQHPPPAWPAYLTSVVPCGMAAALDVGLSNISLRTVTLSFMTICKSSSSGFLLLFAVLFGLERLRMAVVAIVAIISVGVVLMAAGEVSFVLSGFLAAIGSSAMSGLRWTLTQILLSHARLGMNNPIATIASITPVTGFTTLLLSLSIEHPLSALARSGGLDSLHMLLLMAAGGLVAFAMALAEFHLIARTSALTFSIAGMFKEVAVVGVAHLVFGDTMSAMNTCGMLVALLGIGLYNWLKIRDALAAAGSHAPSGLGGLGEEEEERLRQELFVAGPYDILTTAASTLPPDDRALEDQALVDQALGAGRLPAKAGDAGGPSEPPGEPPLLGDRSDSAPSSAGTLAPPGARLPEAERPKIH